MLFVIIISLDFRIVFYYLCALQVTSLRKIVSKVISVLCPNEMSANVAKAESLSASLMLEKHSNTETELSRHDSLRTIVMHFY